MTNRPSKVIHDAIIERARKERMALSATWKNFSKTKAGEIKERRIAADDTTGPNGMVFPSLGIGHTSQSFGGLSRNKRDRLPPRSIVTELMFPNPPPGWPMPGSSADEILAWNLKVLAEN